jgi:predicted nucleic acid-binding protein
MHALVGREREGRVMGEAHAAALAEGCELYLLRVVDRRAREAAEEEYLSEEGRPRLLVAELVD